MQNIFISNGYIEINADKNAEETLVSVGLSTIVSNLAYYGYIINADAYRALAKMGDDELAVWWKPTEKVLKEITKDNRGISDAVVYKNFPREVLDMTQAEYVARQALIYGGIPYEAMAEDKEPRQPLGDAKALKVLSLADEKTASKIYYNLVSLNNRWSDNQKEWAKTLVDMRNVILVDDFGFKENGVMLAADNFDKIEVQMSNGTDVLRLAAALSGNDISLRTKGKFKNFNRPDRRKLLTMLDESKNLGDDMAARPEQWKKLLHSLRPGDYNFENVKSAYDGLYNKAVKPFSALVDPQTPTSDTLKIASQRAGEFVRRFHYFYSLFREEAVDAFIPIMDKLTTRQLANFRAYINTINDRRWMIYPPKSNWSKAKIEDKNKVDLHPDHISKLDSRIGEILKERIATAIPEGVSFDDSLKNIKLQTNDQKLAEYGRGTVFEIPDNINFLRSASYWQNDSHCWFDNGWNFFGDDWKSAGVLSWSSAKFADNAAAFSGDPMNSGQTTGKATQIIDLYIDKLLKAGVRYAVWNILCYSNIKFEDGNEVLALLQWGEDPIKGKLIEPSRCQMVFPMNADALASYVAYVDLKERKLVFMDAPFGSKVQNAESNSDMLEKMMPAYVDYLNSLPSLFDVLKDAEQGSVPVLVSDKEIEILEGKAYVFKPENENNSFDKLSIADIVGAQ